MASYSHQKDAYNEKHRILVKEDKVAKDRGKYLHPDFFGQPLEKALDFKNIRKAWNRSANLVGQGTNLDARVIHKVRFTK